ncbi:MAG: PaaI family thioesterase [Geminicoccaceae bacterium]|nr:MAG: PaaI family thioesterase [Geminicoccaceae bacterium]
MTDNDPNASIAAAQAVLDAVPFHDQVLRPRVVAVDPRAGSLDVALDPNPALRRSREDGALHGGVVASLIDLAAYNAVALHKSAATPTLDLRIDYLRPAVAPLVARARMVRAGRRTATVDVTVVDAAGVTVALGRGSFMILEG